MGTMIQGLGLDEEGYRGARFDAWNREVRGNNDLLILTQPQAVREIHLAYYRAGADIVSTNTFSSTRIAQADYGMSDIAHELNVEGAKLARAAADMAQSEDGRPRFVAGALGPTNRTASISPDVSDPGFRAVTFDELRSAYAEQVTGLLEGGADLLLIETIFDTLNAKAAIAAISRRHRGARGERAGDDLRHHHRPLRAAPLRPDAGGVLEFGAPRRSVHHRAQLRARRQGDARPYRRDRPHRRYVRVRLSECRAAERVRALRPEPEFMASLLGEFADAGLVNVVGGCCGTTPEHIHAIARAVAASRRVRSGAAAAVRCCRSGGVRADAGNPVRQRGRAHQRHRLGQVPQARHRRRLCGRARDRARPGRERRADHRRQHGRGPARFREGHGDVPQSDRRRARHRARAGDGRFLEVLGDRGRARNACRASRW